MKKISRVIYRSLKKSIEQILDKKNEKNRYKFEKNVDQFSSIIIDSSNYLSEMCLLGEKYGTDKSVFNKKTKHQHSYTPIYNILFNHLKDQKINIAELGVAYSSSLRMFREYFKKANIDVFDNDENTLEKSKNIKLSDVNYFQLDVENKMNIKKLFEKNNIFYDIIIDDTSHLFEHQINIIEATNKFLKKNGILVIEDIFMNKKNYSEKLYYERLKHIKNDFSEIFFCICKHKYNYSGFWNNSKLLIFKK
ncbi:hypothetical protein [Candidatus Pelagibacter communis]|uniref:hypothetical protein n=1 Tax=Pelagibacter ubique TaxID=198252 RepID=UPI00094C2713|nr:hypothetical protein [Candidatus Pelagibacter ubique]